MHAIIVGGGIGGLSAAVGLRQAGCRVTVLERAPELGEIGAGIVLWPNALRALRRIGLSAQVDALAKPQGSGGIRRIDGRWLSRWDLGQGACQALEDAAGLATAAERFTDPADILAEYDRVRRPRSQMIAKASARTGRVSSGLRNPLLAGLRDAAIRLMPAKVALRNMSKLSA